MNLFEFLRELEAFYPLNEAQEKVNKRLSSYVDILEGEIIKRGKKYNYEKVLKYIQMNYRYKQFPSLPNIMDFLNIGETRDVVNVKDEGCLVVMKIPQGRVYSFEIASFCKSIDEIKREASAKFGNAQISIYPKGSVLIGDKVITP